MPETQNTANEGPPQNESAAKAAPNAVAPEIFYDGDRDALRAMVRAKESFVVAGLSGRMLEVTGELEGIIEGEGHSCRIYSRNRVVAATASILIPATGLAALAAIAVHNLATRNPDYEVGKDLVNNKLYVTYKKGDAK